jgi:hypothetical protein
MEKTNEFDTETFTWKDFLFGLTGIAIVVFVLQALII